MSDRRTIYVPQDLAADFDAALDLGEGDTFGSRVVCAIIRYDRLWRAAVPDLSAAQWKAVADANNGVDDLLVGMSGHPADGLGTMLWANVADTPGLGEKWGIDQGQLVSIMRSWSPAQQIAAFEAVRCFWRHHAEETDVAMRRAGMIAPRHGTHHPGGGYSAHVEIIVRQGDREYRASHVGGDLIGFTGDAARGLADGPATVEVVVDGEVSRCQGTVRRIDDERWHFARAGGPPPG